MFGHMASAEHEHITGIQGVPGGRAPGGGQGTLAERFLRQKEAAHLRFRTAQVRLQLSFLCRAAQ